MTPDTPDHAAPSNAAAVQLAEVKGQLKAMTQMIQAQHDATNQMLSAQHAATNRRIDDFRESVETRLDGHEGRIGRLEGNERATAIRAGASGALAGSLAGALVEGIKALVKG
jgi:hypothetical protein